MAGGGDFGKFDIIYPSQIPDLLKSNLSAHLKMLTLTAITKSDNSLDEGYTISNESLAGESFHGGLQKFSHEYQRSGIINKSNNWSFGQKRYWQDF